jgi:deoxyribodipyrimidine photo-lyase
LRDKAIVWFRNDLRLHDNEALIQAMNVSDEILPIYVFDERVFTGKTSFGFSKTAVFRTKFIIESVTELRKRLVEKGSNLLVRVGKPEEIISEIAGSYKSSWVYCNRERTHEEVLVQDSLEKNLWELGQELVFTRGKMLYYTSDLPFPIMHTPDIFTSFRKEVEKFVEVRKPLPEPSDIPGSKEVFEWGEIPSIEDFGHDQQEINVVESKFRGGENSGLMQLRYYLWDTENITQYKETRNGLLGWDFSSKFSPWLASGCLSPKRIYHEIKEFEVQRKKNESTYWLVFELLWRDYFRLIGKKYQNRIFFKSGTSNTKVQGSKNMNLFQSWANGQTGIPFIDANMRELKATGFISNRGRQNVASFLVKDLKIDWRIGAEYFESLLIDYDPCSNYGNWNYIAGVGTDPRENRYFNIMSQARKYDVNGDYVKFWIPELRKVKQEYIHQPHKMDIKEQSECGVIMGNHYPLPIINTEIWSS